MSFSRRSLVKGAAWAAPAVVATAVVPTYAASKASTGGNSGGSVVPADPQPVETTAASCPAGTWHTGAKTIVTEADYSNHNYLDKVNYNTTPYGEAEMQHWFNNPGNTNKLYWRLHLGFPNGAEAGATITLHFNDSWTNPSTPVQSGLTVFNKLDPKKPELYSTDIPTAVISKTADSFVLTFNEAIPAGAAGTVQFDADPTAGVEATKAGAPAEAWATINFTPASC